MTCSPWSTAYSFTTPQVQLSAPSGLTVQVAQPAPGATTTSATVCWQAVPGATSYTVRVLGQDGNQVASTTTSQTCVQVNGLPLGATLSIQVQACS